MPHVLKALSDLAPLVAPHVGARLLESTAMRALAEILQDTKAPATARLNAAREVLERGGAAAKGAQPVDWTAYLGRVRERKRNAEAQATVTTGDGEPES